MVIRTHRQLATPILDPYRQLAPFGLTTESTQSDVLTIDIKASFELQNKELITWIREPNRRILLDFFCLPFPDLDQLPDDFETTADLRQLAAAWHRTVLQNPEDVCTLHRLGSVSLGFACRHAEQHEFEAMYAALERVVACWAMVLSAEGYLAEWRKSRQQVLASNKVVMMFGRELVDELCLTVDAEIRRIISLPAVQAYSRLRARNFSEIMIREMLDLSVARAVGGIPDGEERRIACGRLGVSFFNLRIAACKWAQTLSAIHCDPATSYLANLKPAASVAERVRFECVAAFRQAFFDLGDAHFDIAMGRAWEGLAKLSRLAGVEELQDVGAIEEPAGSLLYAASNDQFCCDFWQMVSSACKTALSNDLLKKSLDLNHIREVLRRIRLVTQKLPQRDAFWQEIAELFLARQMAILEGRRRCSLPHLMACVVLLDLLIAECQEQDVRRRVEQAIGDACGHIAVMLANRQRVDLSMKYMRRSIECCPENLQRIDDAVDLFERKIAMTKSTVERVSHAKQLVDMMNACAPHYDDADESFRTLHDRVRRTYEITRRQAMEQRPAE